MDRPTGQVLNVTPAPTAWAHNLVGMRRFDLVIFDCDGVLVDSERLATRTEAEILSGLGWRLTESEIVERFVGRSAAYMHGEIERHLGRSVDWDAEFEPRYQEIFRLELVPVPGVVDALDQITAPTCVASSGSHERMELTLGIAGLFDRFDGRIYSVDEVEPGKPAPDIFLHTANQMGTPVVAQSSKTACRVSPPGSLPGWRCLRSPVGSPAHPPCRSMGRSCSTTWGYFRQCSGRCRRLSAICVPPSRR